MKVTGKPNPSGSPAWRATMGGYVDRIGVSRDRVDGSLGWWAWCGQCMEPVGPVYHPTWRGSHTETLALLSTQAAVQPEPWGKYAAAVARHEIAIGRAAPNPTRPPQMGGGPAEISPKFVEWLMMLPARHVTGVPHLSHSQQLRAMGNGVVPAQAAEGIARCLAIVCAGAAGRSAAA